MMWGCSRKLGHESILSLLGLVWGTACSCALGFGAPLAVVAFLSPLFFLNGRNKFWGSKGNEGGGCGRCICRRPWKARRRIGC